MSTYNNADRYLLYIRYGQGPSGEDNGQMGGRALAFANIAGALKEVLSQPPDHWHPQSTDTPGLQPSISAVTVVDLWTGDTVANTLMREIVGRQFLCLELQPDPAEPLQVANEGLYVPSSQQPEPVTLPIFVQFPLHMVPTSLFNRLFDKVAAALTAPGKDLRPSQYVLHHSGHRLSQQAPNQKMGPYTEQRYFDHLRGAMARLLLTPSMIFNNQEAAAAGMPHFIEETRIYHSADGINNELVKSATYGIAGQASPSMVLKGRYLHFNRRMHYFSQALELTDMELINIVAADSKVQLNVLRSADPTRLLVTDFLAGKRRLLENDPRLDYNFQAIVRQRSNELTKGLASPGDEAKMEQHVHSFSILPPLHFITSQFLLRHEAHISSVISPDQFFSFCTIINKAGQGQLRFEWIKEDVSDPNADTRLYVAFRPSLLENDEFEKTQAAEILTLAPLMKGDDPQYLIAQLATIRDGHLHVNADFYRWNAGIANVMLEQRMLSHPDAIINDVAYSPATHPFLVSLQWAPTGIETPSQGRAFTTVLGIAEFEVALATIASLPKGQFDLQLAGGQVPFHLKEIQLIRHADGTVLVTKSKHDSQLPGISYEFSPSSMDEQMLAAFRRICLGSGEKPGRQQFHARQRIRRYLPPGGGGSGVGF